MRIIDRQYLKTPFFGRRQMTDWLRLEGHCVNPKRVRRLMRKMGIFAVYPRPRTTLRNPGHKVYPYLLRDVKIERANQVWSTDITYVPMRGGFLYLTAVIDWYTRYVLSWEVSNSLHGDFCLAAVEAAFGKGRPEIFNTDQGSQYTASDFTSLIESHDIRLSMDGRGRALDNVFVERLWRSVKYEEIYLKEYEDTADLICSLSRYFDFYNNSRPHQGLGGTTPATAWSQSSNAA